ncbi:16S rRNA (guanine(966)-N(2))-methyltransferase RsmD [Tenacibaculum sp. UWU-22]|uniref:16S rRNA (guanine(966)-N(2))-methyltransferase RsmD n=1 Tax=Tenacibaculum sp. UWU-22 TaxID=3234187 RepID=UPI0034DB5607
MRIISGKHKGKRLTAPKNLPVRPTTDMTKESLFNILNNLFFFDNISVIDLFAGTGNISFEFASRGTKEITAIDNHFNCITYINKTAKELSLPINTYKIDVYSFLEKTALTADIIFADPPYNFEEKQFLKIADLVFEKEVLNTDGLLIIEHAKHTDLSTHSNYKYTKKYGGSMLSFFEYN